MAKEWFEDWFDSSYYHILYQHRNHEEAAAFLERLMRHLQLQQSAHLLDLGCGKGRHSRFLAGLGFEVTGMDLSKNSIDFAQGFAHDKLHFIQQDMRTEMPAERFDFVLNLFTSFGYFNQQSENLRVLQNVHKALKAGGGLVIDFLNAHKVVANLVKEEQKQLQGLQFDITRRVEDGKIKKTIAFEDKGEQFFFEERVQAIYLEDFRNLLKDSGFVLKEVFGNYALEKFEEQESDRLLMIAEKV